MNDYHNAFSELSSSKGGSLVARTEKQRIYENCNVLYIGIGGMGCRTVNEIKGKYKREFEDSEDVRFLAIDSDYIELRELSTEKGQNLEENECFSIFDQSTMDVLRNRPPVADAWLSKDIPPVALVGNGAMQIRAIGRAMLCSTGKYEDLRNKIRSDILSFTHMDKTTEVVIIAGVYGGTGGGTFIDISYMVNMLLEEFDSNNNLLSHLYGVFYTPDCHKEFEKIGSDPQVWSNVQRNGYASLKELDYFVNLGKKGRPECVYSLTTSEGTYKTSSRIFEKNYVYLISRTLGCSDYRDIIKNVASGLLEMFKSVNTNQDTEQIPIPIFGWIGSMFPILNIWERRHAGCAANTDLPKDACGIHNTEFPVFMNYSYSSQGYSSVNLMRDEIAAYAANRAYMKIWNLWSQAISFDQSYVAEAANYCGIDSIDSIYASIKREIDVNPYDFRIKPGDPGYPVAVTIFGIGSARGTENTVFDSRDIVMRKIESIANNPGILEGAVKSIIVRILTNLESNEFQSNYGPYGSIVLLAGTANNRGFIDSLEYLKYNMPIFIDEKSRICEAAEGEMNTEKARLDSDHTPTSEEIETYAGYCQKYAEALFDYKFFSTFMVYVVDKLIEGLREYSYNCGICVSVLNELRNTLNTDSAAFRELITRNSTGEAGSYNIVGLNCNPYRNESFLKLIDSCIDDSLVDNLKDTLLAEFYNLNAIQRWAASVQTPEQFCDEIRYVFDTVTGPVISGMFEKFIVFLYGDQDTLSQLTGNRSTLDINDLDAIWNNAAFRDRSLALAADAILNKIADSSLIDFSVPRQISDKYERAYSLTLCDETPLLNGKIKEALQTDSRFATAYWRISNNPSRKTSAVIDVFQCIFPFAIQHISGIRSYARAYYCSEINLNSEIGRHLDEITECWQYNMPELYGIDTEEYYRDFIGDPDWKIGDENRKRSYSDEPYNNDVEQYNRIIESYNFGVEKGYIRGSEYLDLEALSEENISKLRGAIKSNPDFDLWKAMLDFELTAERIDRNCRNESLYCREDAVSDNPADIQNIHRIIRSDMITKRKLEALKAFYEKFFS